MTISNLIKSLLLLLIGVAAGIYFLTYEKGERSLAVGVSSCEEPLTYKIGDIDTRFGVSEQQVKEAMKIAASLWSDAIGRPLAIESEEGEILVNFVYDGRQEMVDGELRFRERINSEQLRMNQFQRDYELQRERFEKRSAEYVQFAEQTTRELDDLNQWIQQRNEAGGFTEEDAGEFEKRKASVEQMQDRVLNERRELDRLADQINRDTDRLNRKIETNNRLVEQYNEEYSGENRFTKATYQNTADGGVITVNMFLNRNELTLILAHELGHAFGLGHVQNPRSVMHSLMGGQELFPVIQLTSEDLQAIRTVCNMN